MLVLSRRPNQTIVFPTLGVSVQVVRVSGQTVRLGVDAPRSIPVLREEMGVSDASTAEAAEAARQARHHLRGQVNAATMALYLAQRQIQAGLATDADTTLQEALGKLAELEGELAATEKTQGVNNRFPSFRALLVEDNPYECSLLESYLRLSGMDVTSVSDGQEALDYLAAHDLPDVVLLDMRMPRCDGPTTLAAIRSNPVYSSLKVFAISGASPEEVGGSLGVNGWFTKPLNPSTLVQTLTQAVPG